MIGYGLQNALRSTLPLLAAALAAVVPVTGAVADEEPPQTGTRLAGKSARPLAFQINESSTIMEIQALLNAGETDRAVRMARRYVESFERTLRINNHEYLPARYFAFNALCVALTHHGDAADAAAICTRAIALIPDRWTAINNRGSARFAEGRYGEALADYELARRVAPRDEPVQQTLAHNIRLAVEMQQAQRDAPQSP